MPHIDWGTEEDEGVNLLSLDGGGVRGVSSLVILDEIMRKIKDMRGLAEVPKPCDFFHMIGGTSTGGLIAIMLGRLRMSTKEALEEYDTCAARIFESKNKKTWSLSERFRATALQDVVQDLVKRRGMGDKMYDPQRPEKGKVVVCVMPSDDISEPHMVRSSSDPYKEHPWDEDVMIWQAARATTAASSFFKPQKLGSGTNARTYIDAAIGTNNPVVYLLKEAVDEFGSGRRLGCVVSIGTGTRDIQLDSPMSGVGNLFWHGPKFYIDLIKMVKSRVTDAEEPHRQLQTRLQFHPGSYFRFNVPGAAAQVGLHHYRRMPALKSSTAKYLAGREISMQVEQVAEGLSTDSFDHGLTLGHISSIDKEQVVLANIRAQRMGTPCPYFTGRKEILERLDSFFSPRNTRGRPRREFLLFGMGGIGKSEIALKVAQDLEERFTYLFFIDGSTPITIDQSYASIAKRHNLGNGGTKAMKTIALNWMEGLTDEWLMIFDDCNLADRQQELPGRGKGNIIYTSRLILLKDALGADNVLEVPPLDKAEAIQLLLTASGSNHATPDAQHKAAAQAIVQELGCLPLAIDKAAASIRDMYTLDTYLQKLRDEKVRLMTDPNVLEKDSEIVAVYAALGLSYDAIMRVQRRAGKSNQGRVAESAMKVLYLLSFYHHKSISVFILERAARQRRESNADNAYPLNDLDKDLDGFVGTAEDGSWDSNNFYLGLKMLWRFSLVNVAIRTMTISMHVLVQQWAHHKIRAAETYDQWCKAAKILLIESMKPNIAWTHKQFAREQRPHVEACFTANAMASEIDEEAYRKRLFHKMGGPHIEACVTANATVPEIDDEAYRARLLHKLGWYHLIVKEFKLAERDLQKALHMSKLLDSSHGWSAIEALWCLAQLYHEVGRLGDAELAYWELINRLETRYDDLLVFLGSEERRLLHESTDEPSESASQQDFAEPSDDGRKKLGVRVRQRLAGSYSAQLSKLLAQPRTKGRKEAMLPEPEPSPKLSGLPEGMYDSLDTLNGLDNMVDFMYAELSYVLLDQGRSKNGKRMLLTMVERLKDKMQGNPEFLRHQYQAKRLTDPQNTAYWEKEFDEKLALTGDDSTNFWGHDSCYELLLGYANSLVQNEQWAKALAELRHAKLVVLKIYGPSDRRNLDLLRLEVTTQIGAGEFDEAVKIARKCVRQAEVAYGKAHKETVQALQRLVESIFYQRLDFDDECRALMRDALERAMAALSPAHITTKQIRRWLEINDADVEDPNPRSERRTAPEATDGAESATTTTTDTAPDKETDTVAGLTVFPQHRWETVQRDVKALMAPLGPEHPVSRRLKVLIDGGPVKTLEEYVERLQRCYGPYSSITKTTKATLRGRDAALARLVVVGSPEPQEEWMAPIKWKSLEESVEKLAGILGPANPVTIRMRGIIEEGPVKTAGELLERVRMSFGPDSQITKDVEERLKNKKKGDSTRNGSEEATPRSAGVRGKAGDGVNAEGSWQAEAWFTAPASAARMPAAKSRVARVTRGRRRRFVTIDLEPIPEVPMQQKELDQGKESGDGTSQPKSSGAHPFLDLCSCGKPAHAESSKGQEQRNHFPCETPHIPAGFAKGKNQVRKRRQCDTSYPSHRNLEKRPWGLGDGGGHFEVDASGHSNS